VKTAQGVVSLAAVMVFGSLTPGHTQTQNGSEMVQLSVTYMSAAYAISRDGTVVVGDNGSPFGWTASEGMFSLGQFELGVGGEAYGVSADGSVVVGRDASSAFYWTRETGMVPLEGLEFASSSFGHAVSGDGNVVVGYFSDRQSPNDTRAFRWTADGGLTDLGQIGCCVSIARAVNFDGSVIVGESQTAFRWTENGGLVSLGSLGGLGYSSATGVSDDGSVVVGLSDSEDGYRAFRWTALEGMANLGTLVGMSTSEAFAVNSDGSVVVGRSGPDANNWERGLAFRWTEQEGMVSLGTLAGGSWSGALGVSGQGDIVVGYSSFEGLDRSRAFIWRANTMEDYDNLITSFSVLGNDSAVMQAEQEFALGALMGQGGLAQAGGWSFSAQLGAQSTGRNPTTVGARATSLAALSFGRGISDTFTLGATISAQGSSLQNNAFNMDTGFAGAIWGRYSAGGADRTGLQASGSLGFARNSGDIARGRLLTDVALATGQSNVETRAVQASLGYGLTQGAWLVTPSLGFEHYDTTRAAYTESGAAFNASYDAMTTSRTVATLALSGDMKLGERVRLSLGAGGA
jgi:probable HAF family extracellular repeat protein